MHKLRHCMLLVGAIYTKQNLQTQKPAQIARSAACKASDTHFLPVAAAAMRCVLDAKAANSS